MIRISNIKSKIEENHDALYKRLLKELGIRAEEVLDYQIAKESIDARKKPDLVYVRTVDLKLKNEEKVLSVFAKRKSKYQINAFTPKTYPYPTKQESNADKRVVVVGAGPAGLFCAYLLAMAGVCVTLLERGCDVDQRTKDVEAFWNGGPLKADSNVSFGEGGAGTFSDGKLNTLVNDKYGRNTAVLETFVRFGAPKKILYDAKPHVGTDVLRTVVKNMREEIIRLGGRVCFESLVTDILVEQGRVIGCIVNETQTISCDALCLAPGHSARDTFELLRRRTVPMEQKAFALGFRVEHLQKSINLAQYGERYASKLPAAPYKVACKTGSGRNVYSFCMCPGGYVVNASSEEKGLAVNGMSYSDRAGSNANSAIIMNVEPSDFGSEDVLAGVEFQRKLEQKAYQLGNGLIPSDRYGQFKNKVLFGDREKETFPITIQPNTKGAYHWCDLTGLLPEKWNEAFVEAMETFAKSIEGFNRPDTILLGVESRTSSPVRIVRGDNFQSAVAGLYPCGEGAGYAGGIMSAAMDGIRVAEAILGEK